MDVLHAIFGSTNHTLWYQDCARAILIFFYGLAALRLAGRRMFGKWAALDIIVSIIVGSSLSRALTGNAALTGTLAATTVLIGLHWMLAHGAARWRWLSRIVEGRSYELAREGLLREHTMRRWAVSRADLTEALRQSGLENEHQVRLAVLEPSGKISILKGSSPKK